MLISYEKITIKKFSKFAPKVSFQVAWPYFKIIKDKHLSLFYTIDNYKEKKFQVTGTRDQC
jgi:hypothetical protein